MSLPQLAVGAGEPALAEATVEVVRPDDPVRISNVLTSCCPPGRVRPRLGRRRNVTAVYQDNALIRELHAAHGTTLRFVGVILAPGYLDGATQKRLAAEGSASLAAGARRRRRRLHDVLVGELPHGHDAHRAGAASAWGSAPSPWSARRTAGSPTTSPKPTSLISTGNEDELVEAWTPERIIGGRELALIGERVPAVHYLGGLVQTGDARWTAVPA